MLFLPQIEHAIDSAGNKVYVNDIVAIYGYLSNDGYSCDPEFDTREYGQILCAPVTRVQSYPGEGCGNLSAMCGDVEGTWPAACTLLLQRGLSPWLTKSMRDQRSS